jgi:cobalt-zinc-cadmium resistance protein CzcA
MTVRYDRSKIARYGLNIAENDMIALGFAGKQWVMYLKVKTL